MLILLILDSMFFLRLYVFAHFAYPVVIVEVPVVAIQLRPVVKPVEPQDACSQIMKVHRRSIVPCVLYVTVVFYGLT